MAQTNPTIHCATFQTSKTNLSSGDWHSNFICSNGNLYIAGFGSQKLFASKNVIPNSHGKDSWKIAAGGSGITAAVTASGRVFVMNRNSSKANMVMQTENGGKETLQVKEVSFGPHKIPYPICQVSATSSNVLLSNCPIPADLENDYIPQMEQLMKNRLMSYAKSGVYCNMVIEFQ